MSKLFARNTGNVDRISMPDEARELVFPQGIPVTMLDGKPAEVHAVAQGKRFSAEARH